MVYIITMIISIILAWLASPYYLPVIPLASTFTTQFVVFIVVWIGLSLLVSHK